MKHYLFSLSISYQSFIAHYSGAASHVQVITQEGLRIRLPASHFRQFLNQSGVKGQFRLTTDQKNKFVKLEQL
ncbi:DUF2835 domain-containing protein [Vibrio marisflavi]|uniref:DUF2835 domain-containing protein n=1 Tax=Vibrio marisflavi CECT 7928 TaxID=634439 RepID=A0ABN8E921_9VIBR|nr:DUF2835 domain-containing protein [Vibrio marisflavi]CAH0539776.1 hypothetical protein VMF7928_02433 [Vibrio marisflavi CECT 7928]